MRVGLAVLVAASLLLADQPPSLPAAPSGQWREAGALNSPRSYGMAIPLRDGRVLLLDGLRALESDDVVAKDELFDPRSGRSTPVVGRSAPRIHATATVLKDGSVLVVGGARRMGTGWRDEQIVELFDPRTGRWRERHQLLLPRSDHGAALLPDGRVLVAGGHIGVLLLDSVAIYDPQLDMWVDGPSLPAPRKLFSIASLPDGRVLIAGGIESGVVSRSSVLYDAAANAWTPGPELAIPRALNATVQEANGDVFLIGGQDAAAGSAERYDFKRNAFTYAGSLVRPRMVPFGFALSSGQLVVAGGLPRPAQVLDHFAPVDTTELYDAQENTWVAGPRLLTPIAFPAVAVFPSAAWVFGGAIEDERPIPLVQRFP